MNKSNLAERIKKNQEFQKFLTSSTDYVDWLDGFTDSFSSFSTESFIFDKELLSEEDSENVSNLSNFFEVIYNFAEKNHLPHHETAYGVYYSIQYKGVGYSIGIDYGQGCIFYCERMDYPLDDAIDYLQIMGGERLSNTVVIDSRLDEFAEFIEQLDAENIPLDSIEKVFHRTIDVLRKKTKVKVKR